MNDSLAANVAAKPTTSELLHHDPHHDALQLVSNDATANAPEYHRDADAPERYIPFGIPKVQWPVNCKFFANSFRSSMKMAQNALMKRMA